MEGCADGQGKRRPRGQEGAGGVGGERVRHLEEERVLGERLESNRRKCARMAECQQRKDSQE